MRIEDKITFSDTIITKHSIPSKTLATIITQQRPPIIFQVLAKLARQYKDDKVASTK